MKRLTAYITGRVQKVRYEEKVVDVARDLGLKGIVQDLDDGRVKVIAEGEPLNLERFIRAVNIRNAAFIHVSSIYKEYSEAKGEFDDFQMLVETPKTPSIARGTQTGYKRKSRGHRRTYYEPRLREIFNEPRERSSEPQIASNGPGEILSEPVDIHPIQPRPNDPDIVELTNQGLQLLTELDHQHQLLHGTTLDALQQNPQAWKAVKTAMTKYAATYAKLTKLSKKFNRTLTHEHPELIQPKTSPMPTMFDEVDLLE
jgi:acylphosphatase